MGVLVAVFLAVPGAAASAEDDTPCDTRFSAQDWVAVAASTGPQVYGAALDEAVVARFAQVAAAAVELIVADTGAFPQATVCIYGPETALDPSDLEARGLHPRGARVHAVLFVSEALLFVDSQQVRLVEDAIALGLAHIGLWHLADSRGETGYPEPLAAAIAQWYVSRISGTIEQHRATMRVATFFADPRGEAEPTNWFAKRQAPLMVWNPEFQTQPIGDFIDDAVRRKGAGILLASDPARWTDAELEWRAALRDELLQGADDSREWVAGVAIAAGLLVTAIVVALVGARHRRRRQAPVGEIAAVEGFFGQN